MHQIISYLTKITNNTPRPSVFVCYIVAFSWDDDDDKASKVRAKVKQEKNDVKEDTLDSGTVTPVRSAKAIVASVIALVVMEHFANRNKEEECEETSKCEKHRNP